LGEDNPIEVILIQRAIRQTNLAISLQHVENGEEAIAYLQGEGIYVDRERYPFPRLLLTNVKMPRMGGLELLAWVRQQQHLKDLPVVVLRDVRLRGKREVLAFVGCWDAGMRSRSWSTPKNWF
jgi:CheY-like chemotaxis protein